MSFTTKICSSLGFGQGLRPNYNTCVQYMKGTQDITLPKVKDTSLFGGSKLVQRIVDDLEKDGEDTK